MEFYWELAMLCSAIFLQVESSRTVPLSLIMPKLSKEEIDEYRTIFSIFDKDGDGHVEADELQEVLLAAGQDVTTEQAEDMIRDMDLDNNGTIEFDEFLNMISARDHVSSAEISAAFRSMDQTNDGYITIQELRKAFYRLGENISDADMHMMIREADLDGDGRVSLEDFRQIMLYKSPEKEGEVLYEKEEKEVL